MCCAHSMELSGNHTKQQKRKRINPEDVSVAIRSDAGLAKLCNGIALYTGDKIKNPAKLIVPPAKKKGEEEE